MLLLSLALGGVALGAPTPTPSSEACPAVQRSEAFVSWAVPADAKAPPIDQRPAAHLRVATFALG